MNAEYLENETVRTLNEANFSPEIKDYLWINKETQNLMNTQEEDGGFTSEAEAMIQARENLKKKKAKEAAEVAEKEAVETEEDTGDPVETEEDTGEPEKQNVTLGKHRRRQRARRARTTREKSKKTERGR